MPLEDERDYPELNKCPDCETFFASDNCPICGRECPEEMRAGKRRPIKVKKNPQYEKHTSGRVQFVPWYFSTWFIILMLLVQPIIGLILAWAGPWKRGGKILATVILLLPYLLGGLFGIIWGITMNIFTDYTLPVNLDLSRAEYEERCEEYAASAIWRDPDSLNGEYVTVTLTVEAVWEDEDAYYAGYAYPRFFECTVTENGESYSFLVHDFRQENTINLKAGDVITVWGQIGGNETISNSVVGTMTRPCINMLYMELQ